MAVHVIGDREGSVLAVVATGERPIVRVLVENGVRVDITKALPIASATAARLLMERAKANHPDVSWRIVTNDDLRKLLGEQPRKRRKAYDTHAEHTDRAEREREEDPSVTTWRKR